MNPNKILIIGISGTGKTRLANKLSAILNIPVAHYDEFVWEKNWTEVDSKIVEQKLEEEMKNDKWIIEGFIHPAAKSKLEKADLVVYLDFSGFQSTLGGLSRWWKYRGKTRPELAPGCIEKLDWDYLKVMWNRGERLEIEEAIQGFEDKITRLHSRHDVNKYLALIVSK